MKRKTEIFTCELPQKNPKESLVEKLPDGKNLTDNYKRHTCPIADEKTKGDYFCSRDIGHEGPCAAHPTPKNYKSGRMFFQAIRRALIRGGCKNSKLLMAVTERAQLTKEDYESMCIVCGLPQGGFVSGPYCYTHNPVRGNL